MAIPRNLSILAQGASASGVLSVTYGGTGVTTSTGTGSVVLSNSPSLVTPTLGAASATSITASLGTVGAPSYTFSGDTNTGIYSPAADTLAFVEGGTEAMRIDSSGNVGIANTSPATRLDVTGPASVTSFTGTTKLGVTVRGSTGATDFSGIDFIGNSQTNPIGRIALLSGGGGSFLSFGTSNSYVSGVTNQAMTIDPSGSVLVGATSAAYGERLYAFVNSAQNCIGARLGASANSCTAFLATADASASGYDFIGCYSGPTPTIRFRVNSSGDLQFNSGFGSAGTAYGCRAWVNFNGQGTVAIRASGNVSSITDNGVGNYTINLSTAMPDTNYNWVGAVRSENDNQYQFTVNSKLNSTKTTSALQVRTGAFDNFFDLPEVNVSIFR